MLIKKSKQYYVCAGWLGNVARSSDLRVSVFGMLMRYLIFRLTSGDPYPL